MLCPANSRKVLHAFSRHTLPFCCSILEALINLAPQQGTKWKRTGRGKDWKGGKNTEKL